MIPDYLFEDKYDNGHGKYSLWDAVRAWLKIDRCGFVIRNDEWYYKNDIVSQPIEVQ